jgi:hypothetical protein
VRAASSDGRSGIAHRAALAARELRRAEKLEQRRLGHPEVDPPFGEDAQARADGERLLAPPTQLTGDASLELVPAPASPDAACSPDRMRVLNTLEEPNLISVDASEHRAHAANQAGVLSAALDAAVSAGAETSLEKMLAHQVAAAHHAGMALLGRLAESVHAVSPPLPPVEHARLTNAAARLFEVAQGGCLTLQRLKTGGTQTVVVQHVNIEQGGRAVVAGRVEGGRGRRRRGPDRK